MEDRKSKYNAKGMYNGYDKNHKERAALDFYATPTKEVENILNQLNIDFSNEIILEPCCGDGHMYNGIMNYLNQCGGADALIATDIMERGGDFPRMTGKEYDFLNDDYLDNIKKECNFDSIDYIIMNPPFKLIEPFVMKSLGIAQKGIIMLGRIQFLEGKSRYENILKDYPPTNVYVYVDRISCFKDGDENIKQAGVQCYAWFYWNIKQIEKGVKNSNLHWIHRI
jgi:hypothetical protein